MSLYKKYRPRELKDFMGNKGTLKSFEALFSREQGPPHAILFTGPSGCGKTTLARIAREKLECSDMDFYEYNTADFTGVDTIRNIRKNMPYSPTMGKAKVWLIDECHMLSKAAQEAILKMLEDTPKHVYFFLATTNPEKLLRTIQTRCTVFNVATLSDRLIIRLLQKVSRLEEVEIADEVFNQIAKDSAGSSRMALVILDQIINLNPDDMLESAKRAAEVESKVIELCRALLGGKDFKFISKILKGIDQEPETVRYAVLNYMNTTLLNSQKPLCADIIANFSKNFYDSKMAGLTLACWDSCN